MTFPEAKEIIDKYNLILKDTEKDFVRDVSVLPWNKEELRQAHFIFVEELIKTNTPFEIINHSINSFNRIAQFKDKITADRINRVNKGFKNKFVRNFLFSLKFSRKEREEFSDYLHNDMFGWEETKEISNFIDTTLRNYGREGIYVDPKSPQSGGVTINFLKQKVTEVLDGEYGKKIKF